MTAADLFTVELITPQIWAQRNLARKPRRLGRLPPQQGKTPNSLSTSNAGHKNISDKHLLLKRLLEARSTIRKIPTNGSLIDPSHSFPIQSNPSVMQMAQYFFQVWAPQHGRAFAFEGHSNPYLTLLWPFALQNDIYFEALIALCRGTLLASQGRPTHQDPAFAYHRANVMNKLSLRLQSRQLCCDDTTILVVATLGTIDYILGDHSSATTHVSGMRQMVKIRGGLNASNPWERLLQANVAAYEALWSFLFSATTSHAEKTKAVKSEMLQKAELPTYMSHPFSPDVCEMLAKLPRGFCDLGLTGVLSLQMIRLLAAFMALTPQLPLVITDKGEERDLRPNVRTLIEDLHRLVTLQTTKTEQFLSHGLVAYSYLLRHVYFGEPMIGFYENALKILTDIAINQGPSNRVPDRKCCLWSHMMIGTVLQLSDLPPPRWQAVMKILLDRYEESLTWNKLETELSSCFWPDSIKQLAMKAYDQAVARKGNEVYDVDPQRSSTMAIRNMIS